MKTKTLLQNKLHFAQLLLYFTTAIFGIFKPKNREFSQLLLLAGLIFSITITGQTNVTFTTSGNFTVPAGVTSITVQAWGAGGAGGGSTNSGNTFIARGGAGGGGGAYASSAPITVTPGAILSIVVGAGGTGVSGGNGGNGGNSTITGFTASINAAGGSGGAGNITGNSPTGGAGGTIAASAGTTRTAGGGGSNGETATAASSGSGGTGANPGGGAGGAAISTAFTTSIGNPGNPPGGGGGGARTSGNNGNQAGGDGGDGQIIITYTCPTYALTSVATATSICGSGTSTITLTSSSLPAGTYTVTYSTTNPATSNNTAIMVFSGTTGTFSTVPFSSTSAITVTTLSSGTAPAICSSTISANNSVTVIVKSLPITTGVNICPGGSGVLISSTACPSEAQTNTGAKNAGAGASVTGTGTITWTTPGNIISDDAVYATSSVSSGNTTTTTQYLQGITYGFAIPTNATINGIQVSIKRFSNQDNTNINVQDNIVSLIKAGTVTGNNNSATGNWSTTNSTVVNYGSISNLWGTTWSPAEINASNFGVALSVNIRRNAGTVTASVDYIQVTITYTVPGVINWYTASSGGVLIGSGSPFNPVGVPSSGLANTNTAGTTTFYAECSSVPGCRAATNFVITALPTVYAVTGGGSYCSAGTGVAVGLANSTSGVNYQLRLGDVNTGSPVAGTGSAISFGLQTAFGTYTVVASNATNTSCTSNMSGSAVITDNIKTWNGSVNNDWFTPANWSPSGVPTSVNCVTIPSGTSLSISNINKIANSYSLTVSNGGNLDISSGNILIVTDFVNVVSGGTLTLQDSASLIQTNNVNNSGTITYKRTTTPMTKYDYTFWSSPVSGCTLSQVSSNSLDKYYSYDPIADDWKYESPSNTMLVGKGYIIRAPLTFDPNIAAPYHAEFKGTPNNGDQSYPGIIPIKTYLIGNPYPSALSADTFLSNNSTVLDGTIYFWTHKTAIANGKYTSDDYATYNFSGGVGTGQGSISGSTTIPNGKIGACQSFFATSIGNGTVVFKNTMRVGGNPLDNSQFFKSSTIANASNVIEKDRIWLDLTNDEGLFKQTLVGYITGATNGNDSAFDGKTWDANQYADFYSINNNKNLTIQGRALPFDVNDVIPLGYRSTINGVLKISIDQTDGLFNYQEIFLEDKLLNVVHNLKLEPYAFTSMTGTFDKRFILRYIDNALGVNDFEGTPVNVVISSKNQQIKIQSGTEAIEKVIVYDILGRLIYQNTKVDANKTFISGLKAQQVLIVKVVLANGHIVSKKVLY